VVAAADEDLAGVDGHDVGVLHAVVVDDTHALIVAGVLLAQDRPVVAAKRCLVPQVVPGDGGSKGFTLGQLLLGLESILSTSFWPKFCGQSQFWSFLVFNCDLRYIYVHGFKIPQITSLLSIMLR
jgi:hypothetical protein